MFIDERHPNYLEQYNSQIFKGQGSHFTYLGCDLTYEYENETHTKKNTQIPTHSWEPHEQKPQDENPKRNTT